MDALTSRDDDAARRVIDRDDALDDKEHEISHGVLLALRQPIARDLREIVAALRIAADIERIGDYAANVAKRSLVLNESARCRWPAAWQRYRNSSPNWYARSCVPTAHAIPKRRTRCGGATPNSTRFTPGCSANC